MASALALGVALAAAVAQAQISPGLLSRAHAKLEGSTRCLDCHDPDKGVAPAKCLACHKPLQERVAAGKGLHARPEYRDCKTCHVEHQGVDYELVWWGKAGKKAFDHGQTGHALGGKHATLSCEQCHKTRSYLGNVTDCSSCHKDEHRGQFAGRACSSCHTEQAWKPAPGFDHAKTAWPLTGRHAAASCEKCHSTRKPDPANAAVTYRVFRTVAGKDCASCHEDTHKGRLGTNCSSCHTTSGWKSAVVTAGFDHSKTAYPLTGRHAGVSCEKCHVPGRPMRLKHDRCTDCHADAHAGQLARRADGGRCESCHDVNGFRPARFGPEDHAKTTYALVGAHLAVACDQCHRPGMAGAPRTPPVPLHFASTALRGLPQGPAPGRGRTLRDEGRLRDLPSGRLLEAGRVRPRPDALPALRKPQPRGVRAVSQSRRGRGAFPAPVRRRAAGLRGLPPRSPPGAVRARRWTLVLRALPHDRQPEGLEVRPRP